MKRMLVIALPGLALISLLFAQNRANEVPSWAPKPVELTKYKPPHKPHTKLSEVKAAHSKQREWRHLVVDDAWLTAEYVQDQPGTKVSRRFHSDTRAWWIVIDGQIRFDIEGQDSLVAGKGAMVQVPMQTIFAMETVGDRPSLRYEVNIAHAKTLYPQDNKPADAPGLNWIPVRLNRKPAAYDHGNKPMITLGELVKQYGERNFMHRFVHDDRAVANVIYGYEKNMPALNPKDRGHYHPESCEFWLIMAGKIRYPIEGQGVVIADEGDVVYVPPFTFHAPRFYGDGPSCRLAMNGYTNIAHLYDAEQR